MSVDDKNTLLKIRTFADDLLKDKEKAGLAATDEENASTKTAGELVMTDKVSPQKKPNIVTVKSKVQSEVAEPAPEVSNQKPPAPKKSDGPNIVVKELGDAVPFMKPEKIPAFHELKKQTHKDVSITANSTIKVRRKNSKELPERRGASFSSTASIITDNRHVGDDFLTRFSNSISNWFTSIKRAARQKTTPKYTIEDSGRRKGVIQKATTKTGTIFTADNETLREEIRRRQAQHHDETDISWSPNTETGFALLEEPNDKPSPVENVAVTFKKQALPPTEEIVEDKRWEFTTQEIEPAPAIYEKPTPKPESVPEEPQEFLVKEETVAKVEPDEERQTVRIVTPSIPVAPLDQIQEPEIITPQRLEEPEPLIETLPEVDQVEEIPEPEMLPEMQQIIPRIDPFRSTVNLIRGKSKFAETNTNALAMSAAVVVATLALVVVVGKITFSALNSDEAPISFAGETMTIIDTVSVTQMSLSEVTPTVLRQNLSQISNLVSTNFEEIEITYQNGEPLAAATILNLLDLSVNPNFKQSVESVRFVVIDRQKHGIVFRVTDQTTVFGAMLAWEDDMKDELETVLKLGAASPSAKFVDKAVYEKDLRVLTDNEKEVLVYGFINENILLIVPDINAFERALIEQF